MSHRMQIRNTPDDPDVVKLRLPNGFLFRCRKDWLLRLADMISDHVEHGINQEQERL